MNYDFKKIEKKWQKRWLDEHVFRAAEQTEKQKYYQLETFPYPSAEGLHAGHPKGYIAEDIHARFMRMNGFTVLYAMGWDAFGLPTENYAIKVGKSPKEVAEANIKNFKRQVRMFGFSYDWEREINTSSPEYYKWTQWLFIQLFKRGLAYRARANVNWCAACETVLANEQAEGGACWRCGGAVAQKETEQWFFRITDYAERLLSDLNGLDWPAATVKRQKDWIGKSEGAEITFQIAASRTRADEKSGESASVKVFTTRPDTLFGATYVVLAPEHAIIPNLKSQISNMEEVEAYIEKARMKTELKRQEEAGEKTGVELKGVKAINPATQEEIPVWIAEYVLMGYGTGAIMAVPAHDERDFEFAKKFQLPIKKVIAQKALAAFPRNAEDIAAGAKKALRVESECWTGEGEVTNSGTFNGMDSEHARWEIAKFAGGKRKTLYKLRDWSVSRQRYWGTPIPMIHCAQCGIVPVPEHELPVVLPDIREYRPKGVPPLASSEQFITEKCPECGGDARRDPETLDTFVDSSWYYLAYAGMRNSKFDIQNSKSMNYWLPVNLYVIGAEHTVLHLLYSRFITKFLRDLGILYAGEPFLKLRHVGLIFGEDGQKMSKSRGNVVNPDSLVEEFGADSVRLYEMFMGPFEDGQPWNPRGILGTHRFLARVWNLMTSVNRVSANNKTRAKARKDDTRIHTLLHRTIKKVTEDIEHMRFNTAVSALMILVNAMEKAPRGSVASNELFVKTLYPFAPHIAQELWSRMGNQSFLDFEPWPAYDEALIADEETELVIQVDGKIRGRIRAPKNISKKEAERLALADEKVRHALGARKPKKIIFVPGRLINVVTDGKAV